MKHVLTFLIGLFFLGCNSATKTGKKKTETDLTTDNESGQSVDFDETIKKLIPNDWKLIDSTSGDLNKDGVSDLVFALQKTDRNNMKVNDRFSNDTLDLNPRSLVIYFGTKTGGFNKKLVSDHFIILRDSPIMDDPFDGFSINEDGILNIKFRFWSAGSWNMSNHEYRFRYQSNEFVLIGYESSEVDRGSGETIDYNINFLTKKMKITNGNFTNPKDESVEWKKFKLDKLLTIESIKKPFELEFYGIYI